MHLFQSLVPISRRFNASLQLIITISFLSKFTHYRVTYFSSAQTCVAFSESVWWTTSEDNRERGQLCSLKTSDFFTMDNHPEVTEKHCYVSYRRTMDKKKKKVHFFYRVQSGFPRTCIEKRPWFPFWDLERFQDVWFKNINVPHKKMLVYYEFRRPPVELEFHSSIFPIFAWNSTFIFNFQRSIIRPQPYFKNGVFYYVFTIWSSAVYDLWWVNYLFYRVIAVPLHLKTWKQNSIFHSSSFI